MDIPPVLFCQEKYQKLNILGGLNWQHLVLKDKKKFVEQGRLISMLFQVANELLKQPVQFHSQLTTPRGFPSSHDVLVAREGTVHAVISG